MVQIFSAIISEFRCQFHKTFFSVIYTAIDIIALSFYSGYAARDINFVKISVMKLATGVNFIKLFSA